MATPRDYYEILGLSKNASGDEIKKAYRKQALEWHPDRHKDNKEEAERRFKEINEAYQVLSDPQKKSAFDQFGHDAFTPGGGFRGGGSPFAGGQQSGRYGPFTYTYTTGGGQNPFSDFGDPFDIFEQFFGGGNPFRQARSIPRYSLTIDFMEAVKGVTKEVNIGGKRRKIKIPPGVDDGSRINFNDFTLSIHIRPHEIFERDGTDVYVSVAIPYSLAILGGEIKVPTVEKEVKIKIRPGTQPGTTMRLRGQGISHLQGHGRGDQYVRLIISTPDKLSKEQKRIIEEMKEEGL